ncbi:PQQ-dependent sugar dehydrogenase [Solirubrobacter phytolaccae]|uniref:PQQ-dependent sugar dehydrogenase n=1 Tax=Solirubrobacter phytolaccae TaxID=1404360 RepID=A0A9X3NBC4_9ACTN|nr:PQQ-dependent sugar dehydrogenase [Solirubrobacter phytolaccae]MDA0183328.1 PQQ-dependent sugar dehydrogenase [Solirubrobacter phytolaccae]
MTGLLLAATALVGVPATASAQGAPPADDRFEVSLLDRNITQGIRIETLPDGRVLLAERDGRLKLFKPATGTTVVAGQLATGVPGELGFVGLAAAPDFATSHHIYAHYVPTAPAYAVSRISRVSRFTLTGDTLDLASEKPIYNVQHPAYAGGGHSAGDLEFAPNGDLYIATGDNTGCCASFGYPPMDERPGQIANDAQATSANTNNPNGKILRIHPRSEPGATVGEGSTYDIPAGNLFTGAEDGGGKTLREIYAMGLRNPFTIGDATSSGELWFADYGPDATLADATRGPAGHVSMIRTTKPANFGWPYCYVPGQPYGDWDYVAGASRGFYDCGNLVNNSPNNLTPAAGTFVNPGLLDIPDNTARTMWWTYSAGSPTTPFEDLFGGGAMAGPKYTYDASNPSTSKFPAWFDGRYFFFDWTTDWVATAAFNGDGSVKDHEFFLPVHTFVKPMDMQFGADGALYVLAYGNGWGANNDDTGLYRVTYAAGNRRPTVKAKADKDSGGTPLTVSFDATGSTDPDGDALTYSWDWTNDGTADATGVTASHTYTTAGQYVARLTVTDANGATSIQNFPITVGNTRPVVKIVSPADGTPRALGQPLTFKVAVSDAEDGTKADCTKIAVTLSLGHNSHAHPDVTVNPGADCTATVTPDRDSAHNGNLYLFTVLEATYTDLGNGDAPALTATDAAEYSPPTQATNVYPLGEGTGLYTGQTFMQGPGHWFMFRNYDLATIGAIRMSISSRGSGGTMEVRADSPTGPLITSVVMPDTKPAASLQRIYQVQTALLDARKPQGAHDLYFVTKWTNPAEHGPNDPFPEIFFNTFTLVPYAASVETPGTVGGTVPATLSLALSGPATFAPFQPGVAKEYTATSEATVTSSAGDATLSVSDPGRLTNGAFSLPQPLRVELGTAQWTAPVANAKVPITFKQAIGANDALRTGTYSRTVTFTLSTTSP